MAQLDRLLAAMVSNKADSLVLEDGDLVKVEVGGQLRPLTKTPLTGPQIVALLKEIASAENQKNLDASKPATMAHVTGDGAFVVRAMLHGTKWHVVARIDDHAEFKRQTGQFKAMNTPTDAPASAPSQPAPAKAAPAATAPSTAPSTAPPTEPVSAPAAEARGAHAAAPGMGGAQAELAAIHPFEGSVQAKAELDHLLKTMVEKGASDLHLRVTEPPILRHHGEMQRMEGFAPLMDSQLSNMIHSIMPQRNRVEFAENNDTDYAYELAGVARFRANAARDRNGAVAVFRQIPATVVSVEQMNVTEEVQRLCFQIGRAR